MDPKGQPVVLPHTSLLCRILRHDRGGGLRQSCGQLGGVAVAQIACPCGVEHRSGHLQSRSAVETALATLVLLIIGVPGEAVVAEEARPVGTRLAAQRLLLRECQLECVAPELRQVLLDRLGFVAGTAQAQQPISRVAYGPEAPEPGSVRLS